MFKAKTRRHKPLYKKFISLRVNAQYRKRLQLLKFKKLKWQRLIFFLKRMLNRRKKNFRVYDVNRYYLPKFYNLFKRKSNTTPQAKKKISLFYGYLRLKYIKKQVNLVVGKKKVAKNSHIKRNQFFLSLMEKRLDVVLYRTHFIFSIRNAQQFILHKHIQVNGIVTTNPSYVLKKGDVVTINPKMQKSVYRNVAQSHIWPLPPKYLQVNYKTFEIMFVENIDFQNISTSYPFWPEVFFLLRYYR